MPLTDKGFERQTYEEILSIQTERAKILFGDDIDTTENSTFGKILRLMCMDSAEHQQTAEKVYLGAFPNTADGVSLDRLCRLVGISRNPATYAQHEIEVTGTTAGLVPMGFLVAAGDVVFHTVDSFRLVDGKATVIVECNEAGTIGNVEVGEINTIVNPDTSITAIKHTAVYQAAEEIETDYELRKRFPQAISGAGSGTPDSLRGAILRVSGVESVLIQENYSTEEVDGIPAHSFRCYVLAPKSAKQEIAEAIFSKKPIGVSTAGTEAVEIADVGGGLHLIRFSWTEEKTVYIKCNITTDSSFSADSIQTIKDNLIAKLEAYTNGQSVTVTSLYSAIYISGVTDVTYLATSSNGTTYGTAPITLAVSQVARTAADAIEVIVNE